MSISIGWIIGIIVALIMIVAGYMVGTAFLNRLIEMELKFEDYPGSDPLRIFFISDIHNRRINNRLLQKVGHVDFVVIGGDLMEKGVPFSKVEANLAELKNLGPVYFVWGNNDYEADYHLLDALLLKHGVKALDNTTTLFETSEGGIISLMGVDYVNEGKDRLDYALLDAPKDSFKILVSHTPKIMEKVKPEYEIRLILCGHTHGGQIRILGYGPFELGGLKKDNGMYVLTSNGYGTSLIPMRLGAKPETHLITIKKN